MRIELDIDRALAAHLSTALDRYRRALRKAEKPCPPDLVRLAVVFHSAARGLISGQEHSGALTDLARPEDDPVIPEREHLSPAEVAALTGMSISTVRRYLDSHELPSIKVGRLRRIARADLTTFMEARR